MTAALVAALAALLAVLLWPDPTTAPPRNPTGPQRPDRQPPPTATADPAAIATVCDLVALALTAGTGTDDALTAVARTIPGPSAVVLDSVVAARRWGLPEQAIWAGHPPEWSVLARALHLADTAGIPPTGPLLRAAQDLRARRGHDLDVATARLRVAVVLPLGLCLLPAFALTTVIPVVLALAARMGTP